MSDYIRICDVEKYYGTVANVTKAVDRVSFQVEHGEFVGVMGASGSGKTGDLVTHQRDTLSGNFRDAGRFLLRLPGRSASFLETILRSRHRLRLFHRLHPRRRCLPRGGGRRRFRHPDSPSGSLGNDDHLPDLPAENHPKDP